MTDPVTSNPRVSKVHYVPVHDGYQKTSCGTAGRLTYDVADVTCCACWFRILAAAAPWAPAFLDDLRGKPGAVSSPTIPAEKMDPLIKYFAGALGSPFRKQSGSEKAIRELLPVASASLGTVEPVMHSGGTPAEPVGVENRQSAQHARDAGEISDETYWNLQATER